MKQTTHVISSHLRDDISRGSENVGWADLSKAKSFRNSSSDTNSAFEPCVKGDDHLITLSLHPMSGCSDIK